MPGVLRERQFRHRTQTGKGGVLNAVFRFDCGKDPGKCGCSFQWLEFQRGCGIEGETEYESLEGVRLPLRDRIVRCGHDYERP